jgi:predicted transcriptional regulator of viral defense system
VRTQLDLDQMLPEVEAELDAQPDRVLSYQYVPRLIRGKIESWELPKYVEREQLQKLLTKELLKKGDLSERTIPFPSHNRVERRYVWRSASDFALALSLGSRAYLCHFSALFLHGLTTQVPKTVYVNQEQSRKPKRRGNLRQSSIDAAFAKPQRRSGMVGFIGDQRVVLLNGKHTNNLAVETREHDGEVLRLTSLERTLIDAAVRPAYAGGPQTVLEAFQNAEGLFSVKRMAEVLTGLDYIYPYHQALGFYLEHSGACKPTELGPIEKLPQRFRFYLDYGMNEPLFDDKWKLFYPRGMNLSA